jgi:pyruvate,water dikinase
MAPKLCSWDSEPSPAWTLYTTGNVNEVLPGVTRPLYADLAKWWDYYWCDGVATDLGVRDLIEIEPPPASNELTFLGGRWAVNVSFALALNELYQESGSAMLTSFFEGGEQVTSGASSRADRARAAHAIAMKRWKNIERMWRDGDRKSRASYAASRRRRLHNLSDQALVDLVDENTRLVGDLFITHWYVTVGGGDFAARLGPMLDSYVPGHPPEWTTTLTSALRDVESARPGKALWDMSRLVLARKSLAAELSYLDHHTILARLAAPPNADWEALSAAWREFMEEFGWRGQRESDASTATWDESPEFVIGALLANVAAPASANPYTREEKAARARERLEARVLARVPQAERRKFTEFLRLTQTLARTREGVKANWARACRNYRPVVHEIGRRLVQRGVLESVADVWFLRLDELHAFGQGTLPADVAQRVAARKEEFAYLQTMDLPDGVFTWPCELVPIDQGVNAAQTEFQALGVSPGVATGRARVILDAFDDVDIEPGEILVAPITDAPWTPLFIPAAAVVVEMGGVLSHAATVAREFGIPAVSGVKDATRIIKTGQMLTVDGNRGTVTIVSG